jgi:hypothetical protein
VIRSRDKIRLEHSVGLAVDARDYYDSLLNLIAEGDDLMKACKTMDDRQGLQHVLSIYEQMREIVAREDILAKVKAARSPPFALAVIGPPKVGKSAFIDELITVGCRAMGKQYTVDLRYNRNPLDAFDSGLKSSNRIFVFDDLGALNSNTGASAGVAVYDLLMNLFNDQASPSVQADLRDKGKIFPQADLVIVTGNSPGLDAVSYLNTPDALFRRIRYKVALTVRDEFRIDAGSNVLDEEKVAAAQAIIPGYRDLHLYSVIEYIIISAPGPITVSGGQMNDPSLGIRTTERAILNNVRQEEFFGWYVDAIKRHRSMTRNMLGHAQKLIDEPDCEHGGKPGRCRTCHLPLVGDDIPPFLQQGGALSLVSEPALCPRRVRNKLIGVSDDVLEYFHSRTFAKLLSLRHQTIPFVRNLLYQTGCDLMKHDVKATILKVLSSSIVVGVAVSAYNTAHLTKDNDFK